MTAATRLRRRRGFVHWTRTTGWRHLVGLLALVFALFPLVFVVSASLNGNGTLTGSNDLFSQIASVNYRRLFDDPLHPYGWWFVNTMFIGLVTAFGTVLLCACAAYAFSRLRFTGRRPGLLALILLQMFPQFLAVVAIFILLTGIQQTFPALGLDSQIGLILVYLGGALGVNTYLMYGFFNSVPREIDDAAKIDGASHAQIFWLIIMPLVRPILLVVGAVAFITSLNEYVIASVILVSPRKQTLAVGLYQFVSEQFSQNWGVFTAGAVLGALPVVVLFVFFQRYLIAGLAQSGVKG